MIAESLVRQFKTVVGEENAWTDTADLQHTFQKRLVHSLERFERGEFDWLVTACATCTSTIHEAWPKLADGRHRDAATRLASRTMDINQFLLKEAKLQPLASAPEPRVDTYHDPCHLKKSLKVVDEPRAVIKGNPGSTLKEMAESDWCCSMGGVSTCNITPFQRVLA
jgi:glycolate oxidase iron-sulfur subunit